MNYIDRISATWGSGLSLLTITVTNELIQCRYSILSLSGDSCSKDIAQL